MYSLCNLDIEIELTWLVELLGGTSILGTILSSNQNLMTVNTNPIIHYKRKMPRTK